MKIYAGRNGDISEGFVWLVKCDVKSRSVVKITNSVKGKSVFCEVLQIDDNFLKEYNQPPRYSIADPATAIVMSHWYREGLGNLQTQQEYELRVESADGYCGKVRMCIGHPQLVVRVAVWLGVLSLVLGVVGFILSGVGCVLSVCSMRSPALANAPPAPTIATHSAGPAPVVSGPSSAATAPPTVASTPAVVASTPTP